jgi:hypothetical protein
VPTGGPPLPAPEGRGNGCPRRLGRPSKRNGRREGKGARARGPVRLETANRPSWAKGGNRPAGQKQGGEGEIVFSFFFF